MHNSSRLGVLLDAEEEFENLLAEERAASRLSAPTGPAALGWTSSRAGTASRGLAEEPSTWAERYRSGRSNSVVRLAMSTVRPTATDRSLLELLLYLVSPRLALNG